MKKMIATLSVLSTLVMTAAPAFAATNNGTITVKGGQGNTTNIYNTTNVTNTTNNITLGDIKGHWAEKYIKELVQKGILTGKDKTHFDPNGNVKRDEWATMVAKYFHLSLAATGQDFNDVSTTSWEYPYVEATKDYFDAYKDLNGGIDFRPNEGARREDVTETLVKVLMKLDSNVQLMDAESANGLLQERFTDANQIAPALRTYVATAVKYNLIHGDNKGHFMPEKVLSRAEAATLLALLQGNAVVTDGGASAGGTTTTTTGTTGTTTGGDSGTSTATDGGTTAGGTDSTTTDGSSTDAGSTGSGDTVNAN